MFFPSLLTNMAPYTDFEYNIANTLKLHTPAFLQLNKVIVYYVPLSFLCCICAILNIQRLKCCFHFCAFYSYHIISPFYLCFYLCFLRKVLYVFNYLLCFCISTISLRCLTASNVIFKLFLYI